MNCVVLGGSGFIGHHLSNLLSREGHTVCSIDKTTDAPLDANVMRLKADLMDERLTPAAQSILSSADVVFHLAGMVGSKHLVKNQYDLMMSNMEMTKRVLENAQGRVIFLSSTEVNSGNPKRAIPTDEKQPVYFDDPHSERWGYALSKLACETMVVGASKKHTIIRAGNVYGSGMTEETVIKSFTIKAFEETPIEVFNPTDTRTFLHVSDLCRGLLYAMENSDAAGETINLAGDEEIMITELASLVVRTVSEATNSQRVKFKEVYDEFSRPEKRRPSIEKAKNLLGWEPHVNLVDGLKETLVTG